MKILHWVVSVFILVIRPVYATNRAIVFGGNCESSPQRNVFLNPIRDVSDGLASRGWQVSPLYDGKVGQCHLPSTDDFCVGHPGDPSCCPPGFDPQNWSASQITAGPVRTATKQHLIEEMIASASQLKAGDQLLLDILTHGINEGGEHKICVSPEQQGVGYELFSYQDPEFLQALEKLKSKGVKIGFLDGSCFSGGSKPVLQRYGCVITSQNAILPAELGGTSLAQLLGEEDEFRFGPNSSLVQLLKKPRSELPHSSQNLKVKSPGVSLEDVFLHTLVRDNLNSKTPNEPLYSGYPAQYDLTEQFTQLGSPDKLLEMIDSLEANGAKGSCILPQDSLASVKRNLKSLSIWNLERDLGSAILEMARFQNTQLTPQELRSRLKNIKSQFRNDFKRLDQLRKKYVQLTEQEREIVRKIKKTPVQYSIELSPADLTQLGFTPEQAHLFAKVFPAIDALASGTMSGFIENHKQFRSGLLSRRSKTFGLLIWQNRQIQSLVIPLLLQSNEPTEVYSLAIQRDELFGYGGVKLRENEELKVMLGTIRFHTGIPEDAMLNALKLLDQRDAEKWSQLPNNTRATLEKYQDQLYQVQSQLGGARFIRVPGRDVRTMEKMDGQIRLAESLKEGARELSSTNGLGRLLGFLRYRKKIQSGENLPRLSQEDLDRTRACQEFNLRPNEQ